MKSTKKVCKSDKVLDRSTNRCRKRKSPTKSTKKSRKKSKSPCRSNQVRDRSTNRCRKRKCRSNQDRNRSTVRCRKTKKRYGNAYSPHSNSLPGQATHSLSGLPAQGISKKARQEIYKQRRSIMP